MEIFLAFLRVMHDPAQHIRQDTPALDALLLKERAKSHNTDKTYKEEK